MSEEAERKDVPYQFRAGKSWMARVEYAAAQLEMPVAAYIRMAVTERMNRDNVPRKPPKPRPG